MRVVSYHRLSLNVFSPLNCSWNSRFVNENDHRASAPVHRIVRVIVFVLWVVFVILPIFRIIIYVFSDPVQLIFGSHYMVVES